MILNNTTKSNEPNENNKETGLTFIGDRYKAQSGFLYASGYREFGNLNIVEDIALGTATTFLTAIRVYDKENVLIIDKRMEKRCYYERELARRIVVEELLKMLQEQNVIDFDYDNAKKIINKQLNKAYYKRSYRSINTWAIELGILKK